MNSRHNMPRIAGTLAVGAWLLGCAGATGHSASAGSKSQFPLERYFPLNDAIFTYERWPAGARSADMFMVRIHRTSPTSAEVRAGSARRQLTIRPEALLREGGAALLRTPVERGETWQGEKGQIELAEINASVDVPAGQFRGCVKTVEEIGGDAGGHVTTYYCPEVGIAELITEQWIGGAQQSEVVKLRAYGPPVDISPGHAFP